MSGKAMPTNREESSKSQLQSASRRHREKLNSALEELGSLLPLPEDVKSKLDKLSVLKLSVSYFQTKNFVTNRKQKLSDCIASKKVRKRLVNENIGLSDISLEALDSMFIVFTESGDVFYVSENVKSFFGYTQTYLIHQYFEKFVHPEDVTGFKRCLQRPEQKIVELCREFNVDSTMDVDKVTGRRICFCSIKCHAGRQSSHVSPFYYRTFKFDGHVRPLGRISGNGTQYGYFALCTPVNPASVSTSTPREIVQYYGCKMGLDLKLQKLDNRGTKIFMFTESEYMEISGYFFVNLEDISIMKLTHEQLMDCGQSTGVFRLMTASGKYQWIKGRARIVYDKNGKPEFIHADNILLGKEDGPFYKSVQWEILSKWSADKAARKQKLALASNEGDNANVALPSNSTRSANIVDNTPSRQDPVPVSSTEIETETARRKCQAKETIHHGQPTVCAMPEAMITSTPMENPEFSIPEDPMSELQRAFDSDMSGALPFETQSVEDDVTILSSLLVEANNNEPVAPQVGDAVNGDVSYVWTGDSSANSRRAAQEFSEQLHILKSYLRDEQFAVPTYKAPGYQSYRAHPYSNHRKNGAKISCGQEGNLWIGESEAMDCTYGSITANISPMPPQTRPQPPLLSNSPPLALLPAPAPPNVSWDAPVSQGEARGVNMRLSHLDSPPEVVQGNPTGLNLPASLPTVASYTAESAMHLGTVPPKPLSSDFFFDTINTSGIMSSTSSSLADNMANQKRAQGFANGLNGFSCQSPCECKSSNCLRHEPRADIAPPNWTSSNSTAKKGCAYSHHPHRARDNPAFSSGQAAVFRSNATGMSDMNDAFDDCEKIGGNYNSAVSNGYSLSGVQPMYQRGRYGHQTHRGQQSENFDSEIAAPPVSCQNGIYRAPNQHRPNQNGNYGPPRGGRSGSQNLTRQSYHGGSNLGTSNGFVQSAQAVGPYQNTGQNCFPNSFHGSQVIPHGQFEATVQGPLPYQQRGFFSYGAPFSKTTHG